MGERIKKKRIELNYTQQQLALHCNTTYQRISEWETGKVVPSIFSLIKLSIALSVTLDYLVKGI